MEPINLFLMLTRSVLVYFDMHHVSYEFSILDYNYGTSSQVRITVSSFIYLLFCVPYTSVYSVPSILWPSHSSLFTLAALCKPWDINTYLPWRYVEQFSYDWSSPVIYDSSTTAAHTRTMHSLT